MPKIYKVVISSSISYPDMVIDKHNRVKDLAYKAVEDFIEKVRNPQFDERKLEFALDSEEEFQFMKPKETSNAKFGRNTVDHLVGLLAVADTEANFGGTLDLKVSDNLFAREPDQIIPQLDGGEPIRRIGMFRMKPNVEEYYHSRINHYYTIFRDKVL